MDEVEEVDFITPEQEQAVRDCKFSTTNEGRICAWLWTNSEGVAQTLEPLLLTTEKYMRDSVTQTWEFEMRTANPVVVNLVVEIMAQRERGKK